MRSMKFIVYGCVGIGIHVPTTYETYSTRQKKVSVLINQNGTDVPFYFIIPFRFDPFRFMRIILYACIV